MSSEIWQQKSYENRYTFRECNSATVAFLPFEKEPILKEIIWAKSFLLE